MKVAIMFRGFSYGEKADFRKGAESVINNLIEPLASEHDVSLYFCTYNQPLLHELVGIYNYSGKIKRIDLIPQENTTQLTTFVSCLKILKEVDADFIIITRFDLEYHRNINEYGKINYDKINFLYPPHHPWLSFQFVSDLVIFLHKRYVDEMIKSTEELMHNPPEYYQPGFGLHGIYKELQKFLSADNVHFLQRTEHPHLVDILRNE